MSKPAVIMMTSNGIGAGHLIRASAIARELKGSARPIILSMAYSVVEVSGQLGIECEFVPGRDKGLMSRNKWDRYLRDRVVSLIDETGAKVVTFDGVVPYPGILSAKFLRPKVNFVWIRRGMWQKKPQGLALSLQSKLMDYVIEPGDIAREYDEGPTNSREDAILTSPVSLYNPARTCSRIEACRKLGLDPERPAVLVQLGVGAADLDERVFSVLKGLVGWKGIQVVMSKIPAASGDNSKVLDLLDIKLIRYFPLADVIHAFDATICAAGYNSVHEVISARIPTLLIANNRGTDDQAARARWCRDYGIALYAESGSLAEIESETAKLLDENVRIKLTLTAKRIPLPEGQHKIASIVETLCNETISSMIMKRIQYQHFIARTFIQRGLNHWLRVAINTSLRYAALAYRTIVPHKSHSIPESEVVFSTSTNSKYCEPLIKDQVRFEHLLLGSSDNYLESRRKIAEAAYGKLIRDYDLVDNGNELSIDFTSWTTAR